MSLTTDIYVYAKRYSERERYDFEVEFTTMENSQFFTIKVNHYTKDFLAMEEDREIRAGDTELTIFLDDETKRELMSVLSAALADEEASSNGIPA